MRAALVSLVVVALHSLAAAQQTVAGLRIPYPSSFSPVPAKATAWKNGLPIEVQAKLSAFDVFEAPPDNDFREVRVLRIRYVAGTPFSLDGAADGAVRSVLALPGIEQPNHRVTPTNVSGRPARRTSLEAKRFGGRLGAEFLQIYDPALKTTWQVQLIFHSSTSLNPFADKSLDAQRAAAKKLLQGVLVIE